jgi:CheY-like chemotaxis protein
MKKVTQSQKQISNLSILYVENNSLLQADLSMHFKKIFANVYQAFNGIEGLETYKLNKIDLVITDLDLLNKNSFEMIVEMKEINPNISIIVLSNTNSDFRLLQTIDMGIIALLEKPLDILSLNKALQQVITASQPKPIITQKAIQKPIRPKPVIKQVIPEPIRPKPVIKQVIPEPIKPKPVIKQVIPEPIKPKPVIKQVIPEPIKPKPIITKKAILEPNKDFNFNVLVSAEKDKTIIHCMNEYKGLSITSNVAILSVNDNNFSLQLSKSQYTAVIYEKQIMITIKQYSIQAKLIGIDKQNNVVTFTNPQIIQYTQRDNTNKRITVDSSFKASIGFENTQKELIPINISTHYITVQSDEILNLKVNNSVELTIGFEINGPSTLVSEKKFTKTFATGTIQRIFTNNGKQTIVIKHQIQKSGQNIYKKYIQEREIAVITEFKMKMKI